MQQKFQNTNKQSAHGGIKGKFKGAHALEMNINRDIALKILQHVSFLFQKDADCTYIDKERKYNIWYNNVSHIKLVEYKKCQNWVRVFGEYIIFPVGGTQFKKWSLSLHRLYWSKSNASNN